jgi:hypothetical protein
MDESYQPFKRFDVIDGKQPDFFMHPGDTIYADLPARKPFSPTVAHYRSKHAANRKDPNLQNFFARHVTYAIWDDHETEDNCNSHNPYMERALQVFKEYWPCKRWIQRRFTGSLAGRESSFSFWIRVVFVVNRLFPTVRTKPCSEPIRRVGLKTSLKPLRPRSGSS